MMDSKNVPNLYCDIIASVIENSEKLFSEANVSDNVLEKLQTMWLKKIVDADVLCDCSLPDLKKYMKERNKKLNEDCGVCNVTPLKPKEVDTITISTPKMCLRSMPDLMSNVNVLTSSQITSDTTNLNKKKLTAKRSIITSTPLRKLRNAPSLKFRYDNNKSFLSSLGEVSEIESKTNKLKYNSTDSLSVPPKNGLRYKNLKRLNNNLRNAINSFELTDLSKTDTVPETDMNSIQIDESTTLNETRNFGISDLKNVISKKYEEMNYLPNSHINEFKDNFMGYYDQYKYVFSSIQSLNKMKPTDELINLTISLPYYLDNNTGRRAIITIVLPRWLAQSERLPKLLVPLIDTTKHCNIPQTTNIFQNFIDKYLNTNNNFPKYFIDQLDGPLHDCKINIKYKDKVGNASVTKRKLTDNSELGSEDDISESEDLSNLFECKNTIICVAQIVRYKRRVWFIDIKSGIANINGKDYVFDFASGRLAW